MCTSMSVHIHIMSLGVVCLTSWGRGLLTLSNQCNSKWCVCAVGQYILVVVEGQVTSVELSKRQTSTAPPEGDTGGDTGMKRR